MTTWRYESYFHVLSLTGSLTRSLLSYSRDIDSTKKYNSPLRMAIQYPLYFAQEPDLVVVSVYVKDIVKESLQVNFEVKALSLKFQTR